MAEITENYVSFEIAKLLREKGFDGFCNRYYQTDKEDVNGEHAMFMFASDLKSFCTVTNSLLNKYADKNHEIISAPTFQMAMKWLREVYGIYPDIAIEEIDDNTIFFRVDGIYLKQKKMWDKYNNLFKTYEQACEAAIKYCLENLI